MLTTVEAAERLGISPRRVAKLCQDGKINSSRHGRSWSIAPADLEAFKSIERGRGQHWFGSRGGRPVRAGEAA